MCFSFPLHALVSHVAHPGQDARPASRAGGRQGSLHISTNCRQSVNRIWNEDDDTSLQRKSKQPRPEPKCFKWITPVCHCDYTLLAGTATRWIVFYGFTADLFSFFFLNQRGCIFPPLWSMVWMWDCFCLSTASQSLYLYVSLRGNSVYLSEAGDWGLMYMDGFSHFVNDISFLLWHVWHSWNTRLHPYFVQYIITFQNKVRASGNDAYTHIQHVFLYADPNRVQI